VKGHPIKSALVGGALLAAVGFGLYSLWGSRATEVIIQQLPAPALPVGLLGAGSNVTDLSRLSDNCSLISRNWGSYVPAVVAAPIKGISHLLTSFNTTSPSLPIDANCPVSLNETSSSNSSGLFSYTNSTSHPLGLKGISQPVSNLAPHQVDANCPVSLNKTSSSNSYGLFSYTNSTSHPLGLGGIYQPVSSLVPHQKIFYRLSSFIDSSPKLAKTSSIDPKSLSRALNIPLFSSAMNQMSQFKHVATKCGNLGLVLFENVLNMASFGGRVIVTIGLFGAPHVMTEVNAVAESVFFVGKKALSFAANQSLNRLKEGGQSIRSISSYVGSGISKVYSRISSLSQALVVGEKKIPCDPSKKNDCVQSKLKEIEEKGLQEKKLQDCIPFAGEAECKKCIIDRNIDSCDFVAIMGP